MFILKLITFSDFSWNVTRKPVHIVFLKLFFFSAILSQVFFLHQSSTTRRAEALGGSMGSPIFSQNQYF